IFRDPRWGRGQETYGEDPYLTSQFGSTYIKGLQGDDPKYFKVIATAKHYAVHSGPEPERHVFNAVVSPYDLHDTYLPAFKSAVTDGHVYSVMSAYSSLYGVPAPASKLLLQTLLRDQWGFQGYVVSDCGAITDISNSHKYAPTQEAGSALAVKAGNDLACDSAFNSLPAAVAQGLITEAEIDKSLKRLFTARFKLGMFDPPSEVPYANIPASVIESPEHRALALQAARESIVLLKNDKSFLPLSSKIKSIAVIGPNADNTVVQEGNYHGVSAHEVSVLEGIRKRAGADVKVTYVRGSGLLTAKEGAPISGDVVSSGGKPGFQGEYFTNMKLEGAPAATRQDASVNFNFAEAPINGVAHENFSVRWSGTLTSPKDANYTLTISGDDGYRLFIDGKNVAEDWGSHAVTSRDYVLPLKAGQSVPIRVEYYQEGQGAEVHLVWRDDSAPSFAPAVDAAKAADAVIFVGGISGAVEGEEGAGGTGDRATLDIPKVQQDLLEALYATKKPVVLVLLGGSALSVNWANDKLPAILDAWYPGEEGGTAVADVLFGDYNPAGRLPVTFYTGIDQLPPFRDYSMNHRTYRYYGGHPLYPFGYGLSYTRFAYSKLSVPKETEPGGPVTVSAEVKNTGKLAGDEVVQLYLRPDPDGIPREIEPGQSMPRLILTGFQRINLQPGESKTITFTIQHDQFLLFNSEGVKQLQPGTWQVYIGGGQPDVDSGKGALSAKIEAR
ncbi:MAG: Beta-glucosidase-related glycosidase, partial [Capsulimonas sp.]|nr:Beta-glucosidase-related glycosidase [Capsulimonas sp.]